MRRRDSRIDDPRSDEARKLIGAALLALLIMIVLFGFAAEVLTIFRLDGIDRSVAAAVQSRADAERLAAIAAEASKADGDRLTEFFNIVFGPVVTLLGSVTGFYFGGRRPPSA